MRRIELKWIRLLNFKGIHDLRIDFSTSTTVISGCNGTGKTTVSDAIWWLLFGKNSRNQEKFDIKTLDADGRIIYKLPHEVEGVITVDGKEIHLTKRIIEKWRKDQEGKDTIFNGNEIERFYNDVPCNEKEYMARITDICREEDFKYITNPYYFCSLDFKQQKAKLLEMAGKITVEEIAEKYPELKVLIPLLRDKTEDDLRKEIKAKKNRIEESIAGIPDRIDENKRTLPKKANWSAQEKELKQKRNELEQLDEEIIDTAKRNEANDNTIRDIYTEIAQLRNEISNREKEIYDEANKDYFESIRNWDALQDQIGILTKQISAYKHQIAEKEDQRKELSSRRSVLVAEWETLCLNDKNIQLQRFELDESQFICPTCRRPLDVEDIEKKRIELIKNFEVQRDTELLEIARKKAENLKKGERCSKSIIAALDADIERLSEELQQTEAKKEQIMSSDAYMCKPKQADISERVAADTIIATLNQKIEGLNNKISQSAGKVNMMELSNRRQALQAEIDTIESSLHDIQIYKSKSERIKELEFQYSQQSAMMEELAHIEHLLTLFSKKRNEVINAKIDGLFKTVKFRWIAPQINGGEKETCEATINGVPYNLSLNTGAKINAGLDIINALCRHIGITAPVIIDNAESINEPAETLGQRIIFKVSMNKELKIINI